MTCDRCGGSGWVIVENNGIEAARMCTCRSKTQQPCGKPLTEEVAGFLVEGLCQILAFAPDKIGQSIVASALMDMCSTEQQAHYVINRACALHTKWETCGIPGLRQILCHLYTPADGIVVNSTEAYPYGIPSLRPPDPELGKLPPGRFASADLDCERAVLQLEAKSMDVAPYTPADDAHLEELRRARLRRQHREIFEEMGLKPITQEDIDRAVEEARAKKNRSETS
jgi:hypothetical protein